MIADRLPINLRNAPTPRAQCAVVVTLFIVSFLEFRLFSQDIALATVYFGPGIMLATIYSMGRAGRLRMVGGMLAAMALGHVAGGQNPAPAIISAAFVGCQAWIGAGVLAKIAPRGLDLARARSILNIALVAVVVVPICAMAVAFALLYARLDVLGIDQVLAGGLHDPLSADRLIRWMLPHALGIILATPLIISLFDPVRTKRTSWANGERLAILACNLLVTAVTFYGDSRTFLFLICPGLVWAGLRLGIQDTVCAVLISLVTASFITAQGHGPVEVLSIIPAQRPLFLELLYLCAYACILPIAASLEARRRVDADLARSLEFTEQILRNMHEVVFRTDAQGRWRFLNAAWEDLTGYSVAEGLGCECTALIFADDMARLTSAYDRLVGGEIEHLALECRMHRKDGDLRDIAVNYHAVRGPDGAFAGTTGTVHDITEHLRYVEALQASESRFRQLCDTAPIGIFRCDHQGTITYINQRFELITLQPTAKLIGQPWLDVLGIDRANLLGEITRSLNSAHAMFERELEFRDSAGMQRWLTITATGETDEGGQLAGYIGVVTDITQRKFAELELAHRTKELRMLAENVNDVIFHFTLDGRLFYATPSLRDVLGVDPNGVTPAQMKKLIHPEDKPAVKRFFDRLARGEFENHTISYRSRQAFGGDEYIWLEANCRLLRDNAGQPHEVIATLRDISERKQLELELIDARQHAEDAVKAKSAFLANLSHEIRTPMNGVIGLTELLLGHELQPASRRYVQLISESGGMMMNLLNDILEIAKIDAGRLHISNEQFDLHACLANSLSLMSASAAGKQLELRLDIAPNVPQQMMGDSLRLRQVLANLVGNAIKFTQAGHVAIIARCIGPDLEIRIEDTGIGIDAEAQSAVFEEFSQANADIASSYGGTGLGLPISRRIAEAMGGALTLSSQLGQGTTLILRIPAHFLGPQTPAVGSNPEPVAADAGAPLRILVAEDNRTNQIILTGMLQKLGYTAVLASTGNEVIALVEQATRAAEPFDLILMDIQMPELDGIEATRKLRAMGYDAAQLHIIAVTASSYQEDIDGCLSAGMQGHIAKPIRLADLSAAMEVYKAAVASTPVEPNSVEPTTVEQSHA